jgi:hypothetical protein
MISDGHYCGTGHDRGLLLAETRSNDLSSSRPRHIRKVFACDAGVQPESKLIAEHT